jgi:hypothetical protein
VQTELRNAGLLVTDAVRGRAAGTRECARGGFGDYMDTLNAIPPLEQRYKTLDASIAKVLHLGK